MSYHAPVLEGCNSFAGYGPGVRACGVFSGYVFSGYSEAVWHNGQGGLEDRRVNMENMGGCVVLPCSDCLLEMWQEWWARWRCGGVVEGDGEVSDGSA